MQLSVNNFQSRLTVETRCLDEARERLSEAALTSDWEGMSHQHKQVLKYFARVEIVSFALVIIKNNEHLDKPGIYNALLSQLSIVMVRGANDTWSGRENEDKRIKHDAALEIIREILF